MTEYFTESELECKCCGKKKIDKLFLAKLNYARESAGFPFIVDSGYRCPKHNAEVGSTSGNHVSGKAVDIRCFDANKRIRMVAALIAAGMLGIGVNKTFVHCDTNRTGTAMWLY